MINYLVNRQGFFGMVLILDDHFLFIKHALYIYMNVLGAEPPAWQSIPREFHPPPPPLPPLILPQQRRADEMLAPGTNMLFRGGFNHRRNHVRFFFQRICIKASLLGKPRSEFTKKISNFLFTFFAYCIEKCLKPGEFCFSICVSGFSCPRDLKNQKS